MKKGTTRGVAAVIILSIITCGIYSLYLIYKLSEELSVANGETPSPGKELILCLVTCGIYEIFWLYNYAKKANEVAEKAKVTVDSNLPVIAIVLVFLGLSIVSLALIQSQANKAWAA